MTSIRFFSCARLPRPGRTKSVVAVWRDTAAVTGTCSVMRTCMYGRTYHPIYNIRPSFLSPSYISIVVTQIRRDVAGFFSPLPTIILYTTINTINSDEFMWEQQQPFVPFIFIARRIHLNQLFLLSSTHSHRIVPTHCPRHHCIMFIGALGSWTFFFCK